MKKKYLILPIALLLAGCSKGATVIHSNYSYVNPEEPQMYLGPEIEDGVELDGIADETFYDNTHVYRINTTFEGDTNYAEVKFGFGEKGFLAYGYVHEKEIHENDSVLIYQQDSFELYINPGIYKDELRSNCLQVRLSPNQRTESWIGLKSHITDYTWTYYVVPFGYGTHIDGKVITTEAEDRNPEFQNSQGVGYEFYIPYSSLGLDYNPQGLDILPAMVYAHSVDSGDHVWSSYNNVDIDDLNNWITIGNRVFKNQGNNIFDTDRSSSGFSLSSQLDQTYPYVAQFGIHDQYGYYNAHSTAYYAKARITLYHELEGDQYPKVGIGSINDKGTTVMLLDPRPAKNNYQALLVNRPGNGEWKWGEAPIDWKGTQTYNNPILFEIARLDNTIYYYMNGEKIFTGNASTLNNEAAYPILMTMNYSALFDECYITTDRDAVADRIGGVDPYLDFSISGTGYSNNNGVYSQNGSYDQCGVFKINSTKYTMSCDINIGVPLNGDLYPKIGIGEKTDTFVRAYLMDPRPTKDCYEVCAIERDFTIPDSNWNWGEITPFWQGTRSYNRTINLKIERDGSVSKFYMDGILALTINDNKFGSEPSHPMFMTMNHSGTFSNIVVTNG